jgi:hypothetical protein
MRQTAQMVPNESDFPNFSVIARSEATKQSILAWGAMDCFAEFIIGRRFAPTRWLAMTAGTQ